MPARVPWGLAAEAREVFLITLWAWIACGHRGAVAVGDAVSLQGVRGFRELGRCVTS